MRIMGGHFKGRKLLGPVNDLTRPTLGRVRQAIFNILDNRFKLKFSNLTVLDLYAGVGSLGCEALSRGAKKVVFVEQAHEAVLILKHNSAGLLGAVIMQEDVETLEVNPHGAFDLVFMDPPYDKNLIPKTLDILRDRGWVHENSLVIGEIRRQEEGIAPKGWQVIYAKEYASTKIQFLKREV